MHNKTHQTPQQTDGRAAVRPHKRSTQSHRFILLLLTSTALSKDRWENNTNVIQRDAGGGWADIGVQFLVWPCENMA